MLKQLPDAPAARQAICRQFAADHGADLLPLLLLACGDLLTSQLRTYQPDLYHTILNFYLYWLRDLLEGEPILRPRRHPLGGIR